MKFKIIKYLIL